MPTIRAAVCHAFGEPLQIQDVVLAAPAAGEVEVTLAACAICHSDIAYAEGYWGGTLPAVYGHEAAGRISAVGDKVDGYKVGDRVVVTLIRSCGTCSACNAEKTVICENPNGPAPLMTSEGDPMVQGMNCAAFAEKVVVDPSQIAHIPDNMPFEAAALLACGVITGVGAVWNAGRVTTGNHVVVIGAGGVGLNAIQGAKIAGADRIVAVDMTEDKLEDARAFGATDGILATDPDPAARLKELTGRGADVVLVTVGAIQAYTNAPSLLAPGGRAVLVGMPPNGAMAEYEPVELASAGQSLIGTKMGDTVVARDIPRLNQLYLDGALELDALISKRWTLDQINDAIADTKTGTARRNVIVFDI